MTSEPSSPLLFDVQTPLGFTVRVSLSYWDIITQIKHPIMTGQEDAVQATLTQPDEILWQK